MEKRKKKMVWFWPEKHDGGEGGGVIKEEEVDAAEHMSIEGTMSHYSFVYGVGTKNRSPDVPKKVSSRAARPLKIAVLESESSSSPVSANSRTPKDKSPKVLDRRSLRSPLSEKKRPSKITELESLVLQLQELQEELKKSKNQVTMSETSKRQAEQEAEEFMKQLQEVVPMHVLFFPVFDTSLQVMLEEMLWLVLWF